MWKYHNRIFFLHSKLINFGNKFYIHILPGTLNWRWMTWVFLWQAGQTRILGGSFPGSSHFRSWRTSTRSSTLWPYFTISLLFLLVWKIKIKLKHRTDQDYAIIHISQMLIGNLKFIFEWHKFMEVKVGLGVWCLRHFQQYFSYIVAISFIGGRNRSARWKPMTCRKSLTNFIT